MNTLLTDFHILVCLECKWYDRDNNEKDMCSYCYKKSLISVSGDEIAEVCRKCDRGYKYTDEEVEGGDIGLDICRDCVSIRRRMRGHNFTKDQLLAMLQIFPPV